MYEAPSREYDITLGFKWAGEVEHATFRVAATHSSDAFKLAAEQLQAQLIAEVIKVRPWNHKTDVVRTELPKPEPEADGRLPITQRESFPAGEYEAPDWTSRVGQRIKCGRHGIRYQQDTRHAAWIRREARKRGLKASVSLGDGTAHVRLWPVR